MNISRYTTSCAAAIVTGHDNEGRMIASLANDLFYGSKKDFSGKFRIEPALQSYISGDRAAIPCLANDPESRTLSNAPKNTIIISLGFEPMGQKQTDQEIPSASCIATIGPYSIHTLLSASPETIGVRTIRAANLPIYVAPLPDGSPDIEKARETLSGIFDEQDKTRAMLFANFTEKMESEESFLYKLAGRSEALNPDEITLYIWRDEITKETCAIALSHTGPYFFYAAETGSDGFSFGISEVPQEPGIWKMTECKTWASPDPENPDSGITGKWTKLPLDSETATLLGRNSLEELKAELHVIEKNI